MSLFVNLSKLFFDLGGLAGAFTQIEELRAAYTALAHNFHFFNERRVHGEHTLDAHAVSSAAHSKGLGNTAVLLRDDSALKRLDTLTLAFLDTNGNTHVAIYVWDKVKDYLSKAGTTIFIASIVVQSSMFI